MKNSAILGSETQTFQNQLPEEIIAALPDEIKMQHFFWDRLHKREIECYPHLVIPLVNEIFQKNYPRDIPIVLLSTEYIVTKTHMEGGQTLNSVFADSVIRIGKDIYHLECQMQMNKELIIRMLEYDLQIALTHNTVLQEISEPNSNKTSQKYQISFPKSAILYLGTQQNVSTKMECDLLMSNGQNIPYQVDVLNVQSFSLEDIEKKDLNILIPFLPIRYKSRIGSQKKQTVENARKELTDFLKNCTMILNHKTESGGMPEIEKRDLLDFLYCACSYLFEDDPLTKKEVNQVLLPEIKLHREICEEQKIVIEEQKIQLARQDSMIQEKESVINEQNSIIHERESALLEKESIIQEKDSVIQEKDLVIQEQNSQLSAALTRIAELQKQLQN